MNRSDREKTTALEHKGPNPGLLAMAFAVLFNAGLYFVVSFSAGRPHFPGPWESAENLTGYFQGQPHAVLMCAFLQFGSAVPLGLFTATIVSRLRFLGVGAAGAHIALFGGLMTAFNLGISALVLWVMAFPGVAHDASLVRALYYMVYAVGGVGYSVPLGLLMAGVSVSAGLMKLLPRWLFVVGIVLAICGELSWFSLIFPKALFLIPLTRFPGFVWLITTGFLLPTTVAARAESRSVSAT
ncbi:MAG TPA: hypothetical protein VI488_15100 [Candidatus Angelobacter sp.]